MLKTKIFFGDQCSKVDKHINEWISKHNVSIKKINITQGHNFDHIAIIVYEEIPNTEQDYPTDSIPGFKD